MSIRSINSNSLYKKLKSGIDSSELADEFVEKFNSDFNLMNLQLIDLILKSCKVMCLVPRELIEEQDVTSIVEHINRLVSSDAINPKSFLNVADPFCQKSLSFFEQFWFRAWDIFIQDDSSNFFLNLIDAFSNSEINSLRNFSILVKLKLSASIFKNRPPGCEERIPLIMKLANTTIRKIMFDVNRHLLVYSITELGEWFSKFPEIVNDGFLCFIVWALKDDSLKIMFCGLNVVYYLFMNRSSRLTASFVKKVCDSLFNVAKSANGEMFSLFCKCCVQIYTSFPNLISKDLISYVEDHIFSQDPHKAKYAAKFWISLHCVENSPTHCLREIVKYVQNRKTIYWDLFVDVLVETLPLMTNWKILAETLSDNSNEALTDEEKKILLTLTIFTLQRKVYGRRTPLRHGDVNVEQWNENESAAVTRAFRPYMQQFFGNEFFHMALLLKITSYFHFDILNAVERNAILNSCSMFFDHHHSTATRRACLDLIYSIMIHSNNETFSVQCRNVFLKLKTVVETEFETLFQKFLENPDHFQNENGEKLCSVMYSLLTITSIFPIKKQISYFSAIDILQKPLPRSWNPAVLFAHETLIMLATKYVVESLTADPDTSTESSETKMISARTLVSHLKSRWDCSHKGRMGEVIFFSLCDLAVTFFELQGCQRLHKIAIAEFPIYLIAVLGQEDGNLKVARKKAIIERYLEMIVLDVCPLEFAYDPIRIYCQKEEEVFEDPLRLFLQQINEIYDTDTVAEWMFKFLIKIYEFFSEKITSRTLKMTERVRTIIYLNKAKLSDALIVLHRNAIQFAVSNSNRINFLLIMSQFSSCLSPANQKKIRDFLLRQKTSNVKIASLYLESLKCQGRISIDLSTLSISPSSIGTPESSSSRSGKEEESSNADEMEISYETLDTADQSTSLGNRTSVRIPQSPFSRFQEGECLSGDEI